MADTTLLSKNLFAHNKIKTIVLLILLITILATFFRITSLGFLPLDDALRHVAKVISEKNWNEILVVREEFPMDSHPGWHFILNLVRKLLGDDADALLLFSIGFFFIILSASMLFYFEFAEAWLVGLLIIFISSGPQRYFYGRPFLMSCFLILAFCTLWEKFKEKEKPYPEFVAYTLITAIATWVHGTWYLFSLPLFALLLCKEWRSLYYMTLSTILGIFLGACFTGSPIVFLYQMIFHLTESFRLHLFSRQLVTEFRPFQGGLLTLYFIPIFILFRVAKKSWNDKILINPVFAFTTTSWVLGFIACRFWLDWAVIGLAFWFATEINYILKLKFKPDSCNRLKLALFVALTFFLLVSNDSNGWSKRGEVVWPKYEQLQNKHLFPEEEGILYSDSMTIFYNLFYNNPHAHWRYILGFERAWMPVDDMNIFNDILLSLYYDESYAPWVEKMNNKDRLILIRNKKPEIEGLLWEEISDSLWSGRKS